MGHERTGTGQRSSRGGHVGSREVGGSIVLEAPVFVPNLGELRGELASLSFLGLAGCLESIRFAIDPKDETFYFGLAT